MSLGEKFEGTFQIIVSFEKAEIFLFDVSLSKNHYLVIKHRTQFHFYIAQGLLLLTKSKNSISMCLASMQPIGTISRSQSVPLLL